VESFGGGWATNKNQFEKGGEAEKDDGTGNGPMNHPPNGRKNEVKKRKKRLGKNFKAGRFREKKKGENQKNFEIEERERLLIILNRERGRRRSAMRVAGGGKINKKAAGIASLIDGDEDR